MHTGKKRSRFRCPWCTVLNSSLHSAPIDSQGSRPMTTRHAPVTAGSFTLRSRANHRASPCVTAWSATWRQQNFPVVDFFIWRRALLCLASGQARRTWHRHRVSPIGFHYHRADITFREGQLIPWAHPSDRRSCRTQGQRFGAPGRCPAHDTRSRSDGSNLLVHAAALHSPLHASSSTLWQSAPALVR